MHPPDPNWHEYPKWVGGVVVASVAEERAVRAAAAELADTEAVEAERKAGQLLAEREKAKGGRPTETPRPGGAVLPLAERHQAKGAAEPGTSRSTKRPHDVTASPHQTVGRSASGPKINSLEMDHATGPARPSSPAGLRMRRMRERQRNGLRPIALDISGAQIEALVRAGVLDASMRDDAAEIALGVGRLVERLCELLSITPAVLTAHPELAIIFGGAAS